MRKKEVKEEKNNDKEMDKFNIEERKLLFSAMIEGSKLYDKAIITISAGAYGLSLSIINNFQPIKPDTLIYIKLAWYLFGICIVLTLTSFFTSYQACSRNLKIIENKNKDSNDKNIWSIINNIINVTTLFIFIIGFICLTHFGIINISKREGRTMAEDKPKKFEKIEEGFTPPRPPKKPTPQPPQEPAQEPPKTPPPKE